VSIQPSVSIKPGGHSTIDEHQTGEHLTIDGHQIDGHSILHLN
jgi:hypothetical protein